MKLSDYRFTDSEISRLEDSRDGQEDVRLKMRFVALLMLAYGLSSETVSAVIGVTGKTVSNWFRQYADSGIGSLNSFGYRPKQPCLDINQIHQVIIWVTYENPENTKEIRDYIKDRFGVGYCTESVRKLLLKYGLSVLRPKVRPGSPPTVEEQKEFVEKYRDMRASGKVLSGDAMHLVHQNVPGRCWGDPLYPPVMETNSGRKRLNILGAYDPDTCSLIHLTGEENCNADRTVEWLNLIVRTYPAAPEIFLILDNARYFHAAKVSGWLRENPKLKIEFLPPYAPNLNLIERLWGFTKKKVVKNKYYKKYKTFRAKAFQFLNHIDEYADELRILMAEKFEIVYS